MSSWSEFLHHEVFKPTDQIWGRLLTRFNKVWIHINTAHFYKIVHIMTKNDYGAGVFPVGHKHFRLQVHVAARRPSTLNADIQPGSLSTCVQEPGAVPPSLPPQGKPRSSSWVTVTRTYKWRPSYFAASLAGQHFAMYSKQVWKSQVAHSNRKGPAVTNLWAWFIAKPTWKLPICLSVRFLDRVYSLQQGI